MERFYVCGLGFEGKEVIFVFADMWIVLVILFGGAFYDVKEQRVPNWWVLCALLCGLGICSEVWNQVGGGDRCDVSSVFVSGHGGRGYQDDGSDNRMPGISRRDQGYTVGIFDRGSSGPSKNADT